MTGRTSSIVRRQDSLSYSSRDKNMRFFKKTLYNLVLSENNKIEHNTNNKHFCLKKIHKGSVNTQ